MNNKPKNDYGLYMIVDLKNNELPLAVGDIDDMSAYEGLSPKSIRALITNARKKKCRCRYIRIEEEEGVYK